MADLNFGSNLLPEERGFLMSYLEKLQEYKDISYFPISDEQKRRIYKTIVSISGKLSTEERERFNKAVDDITQDFSLKEMTNTHGRSM